MREIMALTDRANLYIDQQKPWLMAKDPARAAEVQAVCTQGLNLFRVLAVYLKPVMPTLAAGAEKFLGLPPQSWADAARPLLDTSINAYEPLATRVDPNAVKALLAASADSLKPSGMPEAAAAASAAVAAKAAPAKPVQDAAKAAAKPAAPAAPAAELSIDDFMKVDLRIARIDSAELVEGADKLLKLGRRPGRTRQAHDLRRHPLGLRAGPAGRPADRGRRQPGPAQDAFRPVGRHGAGGGPGRRGHFRPLARRRCDAGHEGEVTPATGCP